MTPTDAADALAKRLPALEAARYPYTDNCLYTEADEKYQMVLMLLELARRVAALEKLNATGQAG